MKLDFDPFRLVCNNDLDAQNDLFVQSDGLHFHGHSIPSFSARRGDIVCIGPVPNVYLQGQLFASIKDRPESVGLRIHGAYSYAECEYSNESCLQYIRRHLKLSKKEAAALLNYFDRSSFIENGSYSVSRCSSPGRGILSVLVAFSKANIVFAGPGFGCITLNQIIRFAQSHLGHGILICFFYESDEVPVESCRVYRLQPSTGP